jgi:hypothetical protein
VGLIPNKCGVACATPPLFPYEAVQEKLFFLLETL